MTAPPGIVQPSEAQFQRAVVQYARACGFRVAHFHDSRRMVGQRLVGDRDAAGWPDLVLCRPPRLLVAELKAEKGKVSAEQAEWLQALDACPGIEAYIWHPRHWPHIEQILARP